MHKTTPLTSRQRVEAHLYLTAAFQPFRMRCDLGSSERARFQKPALYVVNTLVTRLNFIDQFGKCGSKQEYGKNVERVVSDELKPLIADSIERLLELLSGDGFFIYQARKHENSGPQGEKPPVELMIRPGHKGPDGILRLDQNSLGLTISDTHGFSSPDETFILDGNTHAFTLNEGDPVMELKKAVSNPKVLGHLRAIHLDCGGDVRRFEKWAAFFSKETPEILIVDQSRKPNDGGGRRR